VSNVPSDTADGIDARLLVVDDDENNRDMLSRRLARRGMTVDVAHDGRQALAAVETSAGRPFDLIVLDVEMPGLSGFDVLRQLRAAHPATQLPVIIATARTDREDVVEALGLGANDYVTKPLDFPVVLARVRAQLEYKRAVDRIVQLEADVRRRNDQLQQANARMKRSLDLAGQMQRSLLPAGPLHAPGLEFAWVFEPCDELGGDILNVFPLADARHVGLYLLDVSGHGVPAALLSVTLSRMLQPVANLPSMVERREGGRLEPRPPAEVARTLNHRFQLTCDGHGQFFTLFYGVFDSVDRRLRYVSAGHPPAVVLSPAGATRQLDCQSTAVGCIEEIDFDEGTIDLAAGERLLLYSDGVSETMNPSRELYGLERIVKACDKSASLDLALRRLVDDMAAFRAGEPMRDDVSALAMGVQ
jgi:sigma-B regulation protein RsbU (phosphoserine phosphatase)